MSPLSPGGQTLTLGEASRGGGQAAKSLVCGGLEKAALVGFPLLLGA